MTHNKTFYFQGHSLTLDQWAEKTGLPKERIRSRLSKRWSLEKALTTPVDKSKITRKI